jgi:hypothetical protein
VIDLRLHIEPLDSLPRRHKLAMLRGQITIIRRYAEDGILAVEHIARAERVARELETEELVT